MNIPLKISQREKKFLLMGGVVIALILIYQFVTWYIDISAFTKESVEAKRITLEAQLRKISDKDNVKKRLDIVSKDLKRLENRLLSSNKPPVAAAEIQRALKKIASSLEIDIKVERALSPPEKDNRLYLEIPVEIGFVASTAKLKDMLYKIKTSKLLLTISEMKIRVTNISNPVDIYTTLIVKGFIKNPQISDKDKKEKANAS